MADVIWTDNAVRRLGIIITYINMFDPRAAIRMGDRLVVAAGSLNDFPNRGRPTDDGYRELPTVRPYVILYDVLDGDSVAILDIRHGAQAPRPL